MILVDIGCLGAPVTVGGTQNILEYLEDYMDEFPERKQAILREAIMLIDTGDFEGASDILYPIDLDLYFSERGDEDD